MAGLRTIAQQRQYESLSPNDQRRVDWGQMALDGSGSGGGSGSSTAPASLESSGVTQESMDPWSRYRSQAGDILSQGMDQQNDPSNIYRDRLEQMMMPGGGDFQTNDPSYKFRLAQGQKINERSLAARGLLDSGNAAAELQDYGQGMASQEFQAQFSRLTQGLDSVSKQYDTQQQRLMRMAGVDINPNDYGRTVSSFNLGSAENDNRFNLGMAEIESREKLAQMSMAQQQNPNNLPPGQYLASPGQGGSQWQGMQAESGQWWAQQEAPGGNGVASRSW